MSLSSQDEPMVERYVQAAGSKRGEHYEVRLEELSWLIRSSHEWNSRRLELLTALQRSLPLPKGEEQKDSAAVSLIEELKGALTNAIIMQSRLNDRGDELVGLVERAAREGVVQEIAVDPEVVRRWVRGVSEAYGHLAGRESGLSR